MVSSFFLSMMFVWANSLLDLMYNDHILVDKKTRYFLSRSSLSEKSRREEREKKRVHSMIDWQMFFLLV